MEGFRGLAHACPALIAGLGPAAVRLLVPPALSLFRDRVVASRWAPV
ncbi:hypothetical protein [Sphingomonas ginkgonis]|nr:hypothetical protein [Sphingomonas ginkgonis]